MDSDIEVNKPISSFINNIFIKKMEYGGVECNAWFNYERYYHRVRHGHLWQGGMFYLPNKQISLKFLSYWGEEIGKLDSKAAFDQTALVTALRNHPKDLLICELPSEMTFIPSVYAVVMGFHGTTFTHWTKSSESKGEVKKDLSLGLKTRQYLRSLSLPQKEEMKFKRRVNPDDMLC